MTPGTQNTEAVREAVQEAYGKIAEDEGGCGCSASCCGPDDIETAALGFGYDPEDLDALPEGANMGLSCGNPNALAALKPGETVLDLGSGGGFDIFIAGRAVGAEGCPPPCPITRARCTPRTSRRFCSI